LSNRLRGPGLASSLDRASLAIRVLEFLCEKPIMYPAEYEWLKLDVRAKLERVQAGNALTDEMLRRSREMLTISTRLLQNEVPKVWHPVRQNSHEKS
jgi:hypothetical protein